MNHNELPWHDDDEIFVDWGGSKELGWVVGEWSGEGSLQIRFRGSGNRTFDFYPHENEPGHYRSSSGQHVKIWMRNRATVSSTDPPEAA